MDVSKELMAKGLLYILVHFQFVKTQAEAQKPWACVALAPQSDSENVP
ncbi:hypothetical protein OKW21_000689 [Catalinimonas alkaloidigena]|nr:hypothetical protein [Catalinimonas alkaloidigena]